MKRVSRYVGLVAVGAGLLSMSAAQAITVRIAAVAVDGVRLAAPASSITLTGGVPITVEAEILVSGWAGELTNISIWQVGVDNATIVNDNPPFYCDTIKPLHFDEPFFRPTGAFFNNLSNAGASGRGVCDAASANAGDSCINAPGICHGKCIGGTNEGGLCNGNGDCPGGGTCTIPSCVDGLCSESSFEFATPVTCATATNQCQGGACFGRPDFIMGGLASICAIRTFSDEYVYGCTAFGNPGPADTGGEFYAGTILLEVSPTATGTFTLRPVSNPNVTFFSPPEGGDATLNLVPLEMVLPDCGITGACCTALGTCAVMLPEQCTVAGGAYLGDLTTCVPDACACPQVVSSSPPNCTVDARYPQEQNGPIFPRMGLDSVQVTFDSVVGSVITMADVTLQSVPQVFGQSTLQSVTDLGGGTIQVDFNRPIANQAWVCLRFCGDDNNRVCWGRLPADVNGDGTASPADILELIDGLNGVAAPQDIVQCDVDLSGVCGAPDILGVIDLLNGAGFAKVWNSETLGFACPSLP